MLASGPVISEFMASNSSTLTDGDGDSSDWIEIFNGTSEPVDLGGWHLTDSASELDRWEFPEVTLDAGGYLVVFASSKDRRDPAGELHTNFNLNAGGEYLALVEPDGSTIAHEYAPEYPEQRSDLSYGLDQFSETVIAGGATWSYFVPRSSIGTTWRQVQFNDDSWQSGTTGFGYGISSPGFDVRRVSTTASSLTSLSQADTLLALPDNHPSVARAATEVAPVVNFLDTGGDGHFGNNLPFPGDSGGDDNYFAVQAVGSIIVPESGVYTFGFNSDDGGRLRINGNNVIVDDSLHAPQDRFGSRSLAAGVHMLELTFFENGGGAELELFAARGSHSSFNSQFRLVGDVDRGGLPVLAASAGGMLTDISDELQGANTSAYFRHEFAVSDADSVESLLLSIRYNDAFVVYLNGTEVARRGITSSVSWSSRATSPRPLEESLDPVTIPLGEFASLLNDGENVLAIQALTAAANDDSFLLEPQLFITRSGDMNQGYFDEPTPAAPNAEPIPGLVAEPSISVGHGYYDEPVTVELATPTEGATIRYTTNGNSPTASTGTLYTGPITISRTTILRAAAFRDDYLDSRVATQTYIFLEDVIHQSPAGQAPPGWPSGSVNGQRLNYGMDPDVVGRIYTERQVLDSLRSLPSISLVTDLANLFDSSTGIYVNAGNRGRDWERPVSVELLNHDGSEGFQVEAGARIRGGFSRQGNNPKHAFRLFFRSEYGDASLEYPLFGDEGADSFQNVDLRTAQNYSWAFQSNGEMSFTREVFSRDTQRDMGHPYTRSRYYHLYVNGHYWGVFQTQERSEADYAATYFGGEAGDYDVIKSTGNAGGYTIEATDGQMDAWEQLWNLAVEYAQSPSARQNNYWTIQGLNPDGTRDESLPVLLDVDALIDYMMITFYTGNTDAPLSNFLGNDRPNNWFGIYNRETADQGFQFFQHDGEHTLGTSGSSNDRTGPYNSSNRFSMQYSNPQFLHQHLMSHPEYRLRWADRAQLHLFNDGALTPERSLERFNARVDQVEGAIYAESARWGDSARSTPFTKSHWQSQINEVRSILQTRTQVLLNQLRGDQLYPSVSAPTYSQHGGTFPDGYTLSIRNPSSQGTVYYTLDGSDPRLIGGDLSPSAQEYDENLQLTQSATVKSRVLRGSTWSALTEAEFIVNPASAENLAITEIHYHPVQPTPEELAVNSDFNDEDFEFLELKNTSGETIDLSGVRFVTGITFDFTDSDVTSLAPGAVVLIVKSREAFAARFGTGVAIAGEYGGQLSNAGEQLVLVDRLGETIYDFEYSDEAPWPAEADGSGDSLVLAAASAPVGEAASWTAEGPTPGSAFDEEPIPGDYNGNGIWEQQDLDLVLANWGKPAASASATWVNDLPEGNIDQNELDKVLASWGNAAAAAVAPATPARLNEARQELDESADADPWASQLPTSIVQLAHDAVPAPNEAPAAALARPVEQVRTAGRIGVAAFSGQSPWRDQRVAPPAAAAPSAEYRVPTFAKVRQGADVLAKERLFADLERESTSSLVSTLNRTA